MAQPIRVVVANQPRLMRELVLETITEQPDIEIVAEIQNENDILHAVEDAHPDFLIIALDESGRRPAICDTLLVRYPNIKILALAPERNLSIFFWASLDIHSIEVEASQAGILNTLRQERQLAGGKTWS
jgi:chemotaxis response regulator CheB